MRNGELVRFFKYSLLNGKPLIETFPLLYYVCQEQSSFQKCSMRNLGVSLGRRLFPELLAQWIFLQEKANSVNLSDILVRWNGV